MAELSSPSSDARSEFGVPMAVSSAARAAMDGITAQDYLENPELKVYVEDALRLVLAARPERPLDLIHDYLRSVLAQDNVVGREYAYINATMRNRRAFIIALHEIFSGPAVDDGVSTARGSGFEQKDLVHLVGLICPDFPEDIVTKVAKLLSEGSRQVSSYLPAALASSGELIPGASENVLQGRTPTTTDSKEHNAWSPSRSSSSPGRHQRATVEALPFDVFLRAFSVYFCFQEFFEDITSLFSSLSVRPENDGGVGGGRYERGGKVNIRILMDQLQILKVEPRNQLRYMDVRSTEAAVQRGGLGDRATLPVFLACLLLHSDGVVSRLLERSPPDGYADRFEACPALWSNGRASMELSGEGGDAMEDSPGRRKKGARRGIAGRGDP